jgi:mannosyltransferase OCH1-like enzyme
MRKEWVVAFLVILLSALVIWFPHKEKPKQKITIHDDFLTLLGSQTQYWKYLSDEGDFDNLEIFHHLYEKNKRLQFQEGLAYKIPKIIHFIWLGPSAFPRTSVENMRSWQAHHPDWIMKFWTDRERIPPLSTMEVNYVADFTFLKLQAEYDEASNWCEKSDILRYEILFQEGGIYVDHNAHCLKSFHSLHQGYDFFACLELPHPAYDDHIITAGIGIIGARPHHPVLGGALALVHHRWKKVTEKFQSNDVQSDQDRIRYRSYIALTYALKKNLDLPGNADIVFPASYFYAKEALPALYSEWASAPRRKDGSSETEWLESRVDTLGSHYQGFLLLTCFLALVLSCAFGIVLKGRYLNLCLFAFFLTSCTGEDREEKPFASSLMGIENHEDGENIEYYKSLFEVNKGLKPRIDQGIPKVFHFVWLGPDFFTKAQEETLKSWMKKHPDWEFKIWSDRERPLPFPNLQLFLIDHHTFTFFPHCYAEAMSYREKADLVRFEILHKEGGVVVDWPLRALRNIDELNASYDFYAAIHPPYTPILDTQVTVSSDLMASVPRHPALVVAMQNMVKHWEAVSRAFPQNDKEGVLYRTAYHIFAPLNQALKASLHGSSYRNIVFPSRYFTEIYAKPESHWLDGSSRFERETKEHLDRLIKRGKQLILINTLLIILTLLILFKICFPKRNLESLP